MHLFPSGIAEGDAFCNRSVERNRLRDNITKIKHTVLMAPRRYGKTSLIRQVALENNFIYVWIDLLSVTTQEDVEIKISKACKELLLQLSPELKKVQLHTQALVKSLSPELNLSAMGQTLTLHLTSLQSIPIDETLLQLDAYAEKNGKQALLVFDEFQQISAIHQGASVEALIRHAIERSKAITYVFSGSNRHLLIDMFSKSNRPLYRLCRAMFIERISQQEYASFLNHAARKQWSKPLSQEVLQAIVDLTECHPFYVNALCSELWDLEGVPHNRKTVESVWNAYIETHKSIIIADLVDLAINPKKIIVALARTPTKEPYSQAFSLATKLPLSSIKRSLEGLIKKDIVYMTSHGEYRVLDPALRSYLLYSA